MIKQHRSGGRMQNYYPTPARYRVSAGEVEDHEWGAQLAGVLFVVMGGVTLIMPLMQSFGTGTQIFFGIVGIPAATTSSLGTPLALALGGILLLVGAGVIARYGPAFFPAMALAFLLFMPAFPVGTAVGCVLLYVLWQGMPQRTSPEHADPAPEGPDPSS